MLLPKLKLKASCSCGLCDSVADSSSDYSQRTGFDIPSLQQELRTTPEGARRDPDDPLPDRIKVNPALVLHLVPTQGWATIPAEGPPWVLDLNERAAQVVQVERTC